MIAVDTNPLVYAHREDATGHEAALGRVTSLAEAVCASCGPPIARLATAYRRSSRTSASLAGSSGASATSRSA
jgi:predicted nucleic acid-binding protein